MHEFAKMSKFRYPFYILFHPVDGCQELKYNQKGSLGLSIVLILLWYVSVVVDRQARDFVFNPNRPDKLNLILIAVSTVLVFFIAIVSNWCFSTLMDGKGTLKEICIVCSYALIPTIAATLITTLLSRGLVLEEGTFLTYISATGMLWSVIVLLAAIYVVHDFTFSKTLGLIALTALGMFIILFLFLLVYSLFQQVFLFAANLYFEILYRIFAM